jgi:hypothetical protein
LFESVEFAFGEIGCGSCNVLLKNSDFDDLLRWGFVELGADLKCNEKSHDFGQRCYLHRSSAVEFDHDFVSVQKASFFVVDLERFSVAGLFFGDFIHNVGLGGDILRRVERFGIVFIDLFADL